MDDDAENQHVEEGEPLKGTGLKVAPLTVKGLHYENEHVSLINTRLDAIYAHHNPSDYGNVAPLPCSSRNKTAGQCKRIVRKRARTIKPAALAASDVSGAVVVVPTVSMVPHPLDVSPSVVPHPLDVSQPPPTAATVIALRQRQAQRVQRLQNPKIHFKHGYNPHFVLARHLNEKEIDDSSTATPSLLHRQKLAILGERHVLADDAEIERRAQQLAYRRTFDAQIRQNWRLRKYDFRLEQDYGQAIYSFVQWQMEKEEAAGPVIHERKRKVNFLETERSRTKRRVEECDSDDQDSDATPPMAQDPFAFDEDNEQESIYHRLLQSSQDAQQFLTGSSVLDNDSGPTAHVDDDWSAWQQRLDYWAQGKQAPSKSELPTAFDYTKANGGHAKNVPGTFHFMLQHQPLRKAAGQGSYLSPYDNRLFPLHHPLTYHNNPEQGAVYLHRRQMRCAATRYLIGGGGGRRVSPQWIARRDPASPVDRDVVLENRLLHCLWKGDTAASPSTHRYKFLLKLCTFQGRRLGFFLQHQWKDRGAVAHVLGLHCHSSLEPGRRRRQHRGYEPRLEGRSMFSLLQSNRCSEIILAEKMLVKLQSVRMVGEKDPGKQDATFSLLTTSPYIPVPCTIPPTPMGPMDVIGCIFGPPDRHANVVHAATIDEGVIVVTLSTLVERLLASTCETSRSKRRDKVTGAAFVHSEPERNLVLQQIESMLCQCVARNQKNFFMILSRVKNPLAEMPLAAMYRSVSTYCDFFLNFNEPGLANAVAKVISFLKPLMTHNGIQDFADLHLTWGLLRIASILPEKPLRLLANQLDTKVCRTPFEKFRQVLEYMEEKEMIYDNAEGKTAAGFASPNAVDVSLLEYAFHDAVAIFQQCVEREPANVLYHMWHLGALASSMLLCSGLRIGSKARAYPSSIGDGVDPNSFDLLEGDENRGVELRRKLPRFDDLRRKTAKSLWVVTQLDQRQNTCLSCLAIASILEWKQVVGLILGPLVENQPALVVSIRDMHDLKASEWAMQERSSSSLEYHYRLAGDLNSRLAVAAARLELNPENLDDWRRMVSLLPSNGFAVLQAVNQRDEVTLHGSGTPSLVRQDLDERESIPGTTWWDSDRSQWWDQQILFISHQESRLTVIQRKKVYDFVASMLPSNQEDPQNASLAGAISSSCTGKARSSWEWLLSVGLSTESGSCDGAEAKCRSKSFDADLPRPFAEVLRSKSLVSSDSPEPIGPLVTLPDPALYDASSEVTAMKVRIACHLYGANHVIVKRGVHYLADRCFNSLPSGAAQRDTTSSYPLACLQWLSKSGLHVVACLSDWNVTSGLREVSDRRRPTKYTDTLRLTVRNAIEEYGLKFSLIYNKHPDVFAGHKVGIVRVSVTESFRYSINRRILTV
jgi:hypothetical protein